MRIAPNSPAWFTLTIRAIVRASRGGSRVSNRDSVLSSLAVSMIAMASPMPAKQLRNIELDSGRVEAPDASLPCRRPGSVRVSGGRRLGQVLRNLVEESRGREQIG